MDGFKARLKASIQLQLSFWLCAAILAIALVGGACSFMAAYDEVQELQDNTLGEVAALIRQGGAIDPRDAGAAQRLDHDEDTPIRVAVVGAPSQRYEVTPLPVPRSAPDGLQTLDIGGVSFRLFVRTLPEGTRIAVAQKSYIRNEVARETAIRTVAPFAFLIPILLLVTANLVRKAFNPIRQLSAEIAQRGESDLHPLLTHELPVEIGAFVTAINQLLDRVAAAMAVQKRFVSDAAHELRSPWTALTLQADRLAASPMPEAARERLRELQQGLARGRRLLDQLLELTRARSPALQAGGNLQVRDIFRQVLEDMMPLAEAKAIDIGVTRADSAMVRAPHADLHALVRNLADNAVRYTPRNGKVDLHVARIGVEVVLSVEDDGPGIPPAERARVQDSFYRILGSGETGSGLGLSIARTIVDRLHGSMTLEDAVNSPTGLKVVVRLPGVG